MNDPPNNLQGDLGGGLNPPVDVANYVTVMSQNDNFVDKSGMDTDGSVATDSSEKSSRKRRRICKSCRIRKRSKNGHAQNELGITDCSCNPQETVLENSHIIDHQKTSHLQSNSQMTQLNPSQATFEPVGRKEYIHTDVSPYIIHVQRIIDSPNNGTVLHPITFGNFMKRGGFKNIITGSIKRIGRNKCAVAFSTFIDANDFLNSNLLSINRFKAFIPTFNVTRMGIVRGVPSEWSLEEIEANISTPIGCGKIIKLRRLNYKVQINGSPVWKPSESIVITFDGQVLPKRVFMCYNALNVDTYVYPTIQCFRCCRYGHTKLQCRAAEPRCFKCGQNHSAESCSIAEDCASCINCSGFHFAINKACPEFKRQRDIKNTMAHSCISYLEASKLHPSSSLSYADKVVSGSKISQSDSKSAYFHTNDNANNSPRTISYKKTVFKKPRSPPTSASGYDRAAHNAIINESSSPSLRNGCALQNKPEQKEDHEQIMDLINSLIKMLQNKKYIKPNNADLICKLLTDKNDYGFDYSMERQVSN